MERNSNIIPISELLAHEPWLRRVVIDLVDENEVDDILQETWIAALAARRIAHPRAWLRGVVQNLALARRRGHARRRQREGSAAQDEALPATDTIVERLHAHRELSEAVASLDEPYRTVVLLRYFEDLSPQQISDRLAVPVSTVRTQVERGLRQVRGRLEGRDVRALAILVLGPRAGEAIVPITMPGQLLTWGAGVFAMTIRQKILFAGVLIALVASMSFLLGNEPLGATDHSPSDPLRVALAGEPEAAKAVQRTELNPPPSQAVAKQETGVLLRGRVLDARAVPVSGVPLTFYKSGYPIVTSVLIGVQPIESGPSIDLGLTDHEGRFAVPVDAPHGYLSAGGDFITVRFSVPELENRSSEDALVIVARRTSIRGRVVDRSRNPLDAVSIVPMLDGLLDYDGPLDQTNRVGIPFAKTSADGSFELLNIPDLPELELRMSKPGYQSQSLHEVAGEDGILVTMKKAPKGGYRVRGTVIDHLGRLVSGATVILYQSMVQTGRFGEFEIASRALPEGSLLGAGYPGFQPVRALQVVEALRNGETVAPVTLQLGDRALEITGRVVDQDGKAFSGAILTMLDATKLGPWLTIEDFVAGRSSEPENQNGNVIKVDARSGKDGEFSLLGLSARSYRVRVFDLETLASHTVDLVAGTSDVELPLDTTSRRKVEGTVTSRRGIPIGGVTVVWGLWTNDSQGKGIGIRTFAAGKATKTDINGHFSLKAIPMGDAALNLSSRKITDHEESLSGVLDGAFLHIKPLIKCRVRLRLADQTATKVKFLDADGELVEISRTMKQMSTSGYSWKLKRGRTPILEVSETARTLVVLRDGEEVARHKVDVSAAKLVTLQF